MPELHFNEQTQNDIKASISKAISQLQFFAHILDHADTKTAETHLSLMEYTLEELCKLTGLSTTEIRNVQTLQAHIKELSERVHQLETHTADQMLQETSTCLQRMQEIFRTWYEAAGFHYASIEFNQSGMYADFSSEVGDGQHLSRDSLNFVNFLNRFSSLRTTEGIKIAKEEGSYNRYHIIDCDATRAGIEKLFKEALPNTHVVEWSSRQDQGLWLLRVKVYVYYTDIAALLN